MEKSNQKQPEGTRKAKRRPKPLPEFQSRIRQLAAQSASAANEGRDDDANLLLNELFVSMAMNPPSGKKRTRDEAIEMLVRFYVDQLDPLRRDPRTQSLIDLLTH
jgi:hypothetical protein